MEFKKHPTDGEGKKTRTEPINASNESNKTLNFPIREGRGRIIIQVEVVEGLDRRNPVPSSSGRFS